MKFRSIRVGLLLQLAVATAATLTAAMPAQAQDGTWTSVTGSPTTPGPRREHGAIFDRENQRYLMFTGRSGTLAQKFIVFNDIWSLDVSGSPTWSHVPISGPLPGPRHSPQWGYDAARNRVLIFGGYGAHYPGGAYGFLNDVWELSLDGTPYWTELFPTGQTPTGRLAGAAVYDPMRQRFVGFGGTINAPVDTWVLNLRGQANWVPLPIGGVRPNGGWGMTSVYDARGDRMLIFGGSTSDDYYGSNNDVWELKLRGLPIWTKLTTTGTRPSPRRSGTAIFDPIRNRMVVYGGFDAVPGSDQFLADTWALDFGSEPPAWMELAPAGTIPPGRDVMSAGYDPIHDRMILYGGWSGDDYLGDTQFLDWGGTSADASLTADVSATPAVAHLEWDVQAATGTYAAVYRRDTGGAWTALAEAEVDATGTLVYEDATVQQGGEYSYMMVVGSERGETFGGETLVQVPITTAVEPDRATFAIGRVAPNPAFDRMRVTFTLPSAEPATLELLDVTGRRWLAREVGSLGAGIHSLELATAGQVPPGLYFLRLAQGARVASSRVAVSGTR